jgi:hypothetical protein
LLAIEFMKKRTLISFIVVFLSVSISAQVKTIIITEQGLPYQEQAYFYSGSGNSLDESTIKKYWDSGKRITSAAYTKNGWFIAMSLKSGISAQSYKYSSDWPDKWIDEKWNEGYSITSVAGSPSKWLVVMSKGSGITNQAWTKRGTKEEIVERIKAFRAKGSRIMDICYNGNTWVAVFGTSPKIVSQNYFWANENNLNSKIDNLVWNKNHNVQLMQYANGEYLVVHCKYKKNNNRLQYYITNPSDIQKIVKQKWDEKYDISYIGGGHNTSSASSTSTTSPSRQVASTPSTTQEPNKTSKIPPYIDCAYCNGTGKYMCTFCGGQGWRMVNTFIMYQGYVMNKVTCQVCSGTGKSNMCMYCNSSGKRPNPDYVNSNGVPASPGGSYYPSSSGVVPISGGSTGGSNSSSSSRSSGSRSSVYTKCNSCNGTGICTRCGGKKGSWEYTDHYTGNGTKSWINCGGCNGSGKCIICYGRGKL